MIFLLLALLNSAASPDEQLWKQIKSEPNLVIMMQHTGATPGDSLHWDASGNCKDEVSLSDEGREEARKIGGLFGERGVVPVVISSPMCRCRDTATLAFGETFATDSLLRATELDDTERAGAFEGRAMSLIAANRGAAPIVFISHESNINLLTLESVEGPQAVVGRANAAGEVEVLGRLTLHN